jgi:hypothetical protein
VSAADGAAADIDTAPFFLMDIVCGEYSILALARRADRGAGRFYSNASSDDPLGMGRREQAWPVN